MSATLIQSPSLLHITGNRVYRGGKQTWYRTFRQRLAGCGPTSGANVLWYLAQTHPGCRPLVPWDAGTKEGFLELMEAVWKYITPGFQGVNRAGLFARGMERYGGERGIPLTCRILEVPREPGERPGLQELERFLLAAFSRNLPVAFLNLDNGEETRLDRWHWVTLVGLEAGRATVYDQGLGFCIDLPLWLRTTRLGGGFVVTQPPAQEP